MQAQLPIEVVEKILYDTRVLDIWSYCQTNMAATEVCNDEKFWKCYLEHNYDIRLLKEAIASNHFEIIPEDTGNIDDVWEEIMVRAPSEELVNINNRYVRAMLYLEGGKIIRNFVRNQMGIPVKNKYAFISLYDPMTAFINDVASGYLYGDEIAVFLNDNLQLEIKSLRDKAVKVTVAFNSVLHQANLINIYVKDITVNDILLIDYITDWE